MKRRDRRRPGKGRDLDSEDPLSLGWRAAAWLLATNRSGPAAFARPFDGARPDGRARPEVTNFTRML
jgi:hypothetical protein